MNIIACLSDSVVGYSYDFAVIVQLIVTAISLGQNRVIIEEGSVLIANTGAQFNKVNKIQFFQNFVIKMMPLIHGHCCKLADTDA